jgi:hypothetical protein
MQPRLLKKISYIYLVLVPLLTAIPAFIIGHISPVVYIPIWIINTILMVAAVWVIGAHVFKGNSTEKKQLAFIGILLVLPWMFIAVFLWHGPTAWFACGLGGAGNRTTNALHDPYAEWCFNCFWI